MFLCRMNNNERSALTISFQHDWNDSRLPISRAVYLSTVRLGVGRWMEWQASTSTSLLLLLEMATIYTYTTVPFIEPESDHCLTMSVYLLTHCPIPRNWHHTYLHCSIFDISLYSSPQKIHQAYDQFHLDTQNFQKKKYK